MDEVNYEVNPSNCHFPLSTKNIEVNGCLKHSHKHAHLIMLSHKYINQNIHGQLLKPDNETKLTDETWPGTVIEKCGFCINDGQ